MYVAITASEPVCPRVDGEGAHDEQKQSGAKAMSCLYECLHHKCFINLLVGSQCSRYEELSALPNNPAGIRGQVLAYAAGDVEGTCAFKSTTDHLKTWVWDGDW